MISPSVNWNWYEYFLYGAVVRRKCDMECRELSRTSLPELNAE